MTRTHGLLALLFISELCAFSSFGAPELAPVTPDERRAYIRKSQIWAPTDIASLDLLNGPHEEGDLPFDATHECHYVKKKRAGTSEKFYCAVLPSKSLKVKYGRGNSEVYATVAANRLFWALGFFVDRNYPVRVLCHNCPKHPWEDPDGTPGTWLFNPSILERPIPGAKIEEPGKKLQGWSWQELETVNESQGGATRAQIDALKLLAVFIGHTDSGHRNQRLYCPEKMIVDDGHGNRTCSQPIMFVHDLGTTFGASVKEPDEESESMTYKNWSSSPIWEDRAECIGHLTARQSGTDKLRYPKISESGRRFLAELLLQLSDKQILDLFRASRAERYDTNAKVADWLRAFKKKRQEIVEHRCP